MLLQEDVALVERGPEALPELCVGVVHVPAVVRVRHVGGRRRQERELRRGGAPRRAHEEVDVPLVVFSAQSRGVDAAAQVFGNAVLEIRLPADVVVVVVVKVDGAVLLGRVAPALLGAAPGVTLCTARGEIPGATVQLVRADVADAVAADVEREVPGRDDRGVELAGLDVRAERCHRGG